MIIMATVWEIAILKELQIQLETLSELIRRCMNKNLQIDVNKKVVNII
jgi:hypothetical protein